MPLVYLFVLFSDTMKNFLDITLACMCMSSLECSRKTRWCMTECALSMLHGWGMSTCS